MREDPFDDVELARSSGSTTVPTSATPLAYEIGCRQARVAVCLTSSRRSFVGTDTSIWWSSSSWMDLKRRLWWLPVTFIFV